MSDRISINDLKRMLVEAARCLRENNELLSELDSVCGDGDHGTTMLRAAEQLEAAAGDVSLESPAALLKDGGWKLLSIDGGASSALLGTFIGGMGDAAGEADLDCRSLAIVFEAGMKALFKQTKARPGDKTMVDAIAPAVAALKQAADAGATIADALEQAAAAAARGAESTKALVARYAGARSIALLFHGFSQAFQEQAEINHGG
jgi:dihydroxyacetone kinase-like protein